MGDKCVFKNYSNNDWVKAEVIEKLSPVTNFVKTTECLIWKRHKDQILESNLEWTSKTAVYDQTKISDSKPKIYIEPIMNDYENI